MLSNRCKFVAGLFLGVLSLSLWAQSPPRQKIYTDVMQGNLAAEFSTADYLVRPHLIGQNQFLAGSLDPTGFFSGTFSFAAAGFNWFGKGDYTPSPRLPSPGVYNVQAGIAQGNVWGAGLMYQFDKESTKNAALNGDTVDLKTVYVGDAFGAFASYNLGQISLFGSANFTTKPLNYYSYKGNSSFEHNALTTQLTFGLVKDSQGEKNHAFGATLVVTLEKVESDSINPLDIFETYRQGLDTSANSVVLHLSHGYPILYREGLGVFIGSNNALYYASNKDKGNEASQMGIRLVPNFAVQKSLGKGFEFSMGAGVVVLDYLRKTPDVKPKLIQSSLSTRKNGAGSNTKGIDSDVKLGIRWVKENLAIEGELSKALFTNGPNIIGGGTPGMLSSVGISVGF